MMRLARLAILFFIAMLQSSFFDAFERPALLPHRMKLKDDTNLTSVVLAIITACKDVFTTCGSFPCLYFVHDENRRACVRVDIDGGNIKSWLLEASLLKNKDDSNTPIRLELGTCISKLSILTRCKRRGSTIGGEFVGSWDFSDPGTREGKDDHYRWGFKCVIMEYFSKCIFILYDRADPELTPGSESL
jgi:hypothetical protein